MNKRQVQGVERVLNTKQVIEETVKVLAGVELPVCCAKAISAIQGGIHNLQMVLVMMNEEEKARQEQTKEGEEDGKA